MDGESIASPGVGGEGDRGGLAHPLRRTTEEPAALTPAEPPHPPPRRYTLDTRDTGTPMQLSMTPPEGGYDVALRLTITDHVAELDDAVTVEVQVRRLDQEWEPLATLRLDGRGRDFLSSSVEDLVHAWHYEDRRAIVREAQRDEREARKHARRHSRVGNG